MSNLNFIPHLFFSFVLFFSAGCAQTLRVDSISPDPQVGGPVSLASNVKVAFEPFKITSKDQQENIIGEAKVGLVNSIANIVSTEQVTSMVANAVKKGFRDAGFNIVTLSDAGFIVMGMVEKFWVDEYATGLSFEYSKASVRYDIIIRNRQGATIWANTLDVYKTSDQAMDTTENDIPTLSVALKESVEAIFKDQSFWNAISR
jgi:hypothetical protein